MTRARDELYLSYSGEATEWLKRDSRAAPAIATEINGLEQSDSNPERDLNKRKCGAAAVPVPVQPMRRNRPIPQLGHLLQETGNLVHPPDRPSQLGMLGDANTFDPLINPRTTNGALITSRIDGVCDPL
jgi:hypothetical protein